ncbi:MAG: site-specific integrase [Erysipelotrichaceae bacterium]|nr:site-specific integrase [Erysipelotrichaceae bacterium]
MIKTLSSDWVRTIDSSTGHRYTFCGALEFRYSHIAVHWNPETRRKYERDYNEVILPALNNHNDKSIEEYTKEDYEKAIDLIRERGYERNGINRQYSESSIQHFQNLIYYVVFQSSVVGLCEDVLWGTQFVINEIGEEEELESRVHLKKSLTVNQEQHLYIELFSRIDEDGARVALLLMWGLGLRNAEACGLNYGDIKEIEGHPGCFVAWIYKTTKIDSNELQSGGKTYNTGRIVSVPEKIVDFLMKRKELIREIATNNGDSEVNIDELPICNDGWLEFETDSYKKRSSADASTIMAHTVFEVAGITSEQIAYLDAELNESNTATILKEKDPTAYLLRRNFATQMCILGLSNAEMQYLMGHCVEDAYESRNDFVDSERLYEMHCKLKRRYILNDNASDNDEIIAVSGREKMKIHVSSLEPSDTIEIKVISCESQDPVKTQWFESVEAPAYDRTINNLDIINRDYRSSGERK